ncbi:MAG: hypothetical protein LUD15_02535 [Bacteroides sp.]|nr:hypothetical protein [Bacteroides sp.]
MIQRAVERRKILESMARESDALSRMDFKFLYNEKKKLFTIGYNVME